MEIIQPTDTTHWKSLRAKDVTSTEIGALFGLASASYIPTEFELWHRKKDLSIVEFEGDDRVKWGKRLEDTIARGIAEDNGWNIRRMSEYIRLPEFRIGASFDYILDDGSLLEIKNVDALQLKEKWIVEESNVEAPPHIELQVQHQLCVSGAPFAYIGALIGGNKVLLEKRERNEKVIEAIKKKAAAFWKSIDQNKEPKPNFERDADFISNLYSFAEPGKTVTGNPQIEALVKKYKKAADEANAAEKRKDAAKAEMLTLIGDAEKIKGDGWSVSAGLVAPAQVSYVRPGYRNFRVYVKNGGQTNGRDN